MDTEKLEQANALHKKIKDAEEKISHVQRVFARADPSCERDMRNALLEAANVLFTRISTDRLMCFVRDSEEALKRELAQDRKTFEAL